MHLRPSISIGKRLLPLTSLEEAFLGFICLSIFTFGMVIQGAVAAIIEPTIPHLFALLPGVVLNITSALSIRYMNRKA